MTYPLNFNPKDITSYTALNQLYTSDAMKDIVKRQYEYLRANPYGVYNPILRPLTWTLTGGAVGFCASTKIVDHFKIKKGKEAIQVGGAAIGCGVGTYLYIYRNERNMFFKIWKDLRMESITNSYVFTKHEKDLFLNQFLDCINYTPIKVPVRLASGDLMDLDTLKQIKPDRNGDILCPTTRAKLDINNPNIDLELHLLIIKRIQFLLQQDLTQLDSDSDDYRATKLQLDFIERRLISVHAQHLKGLNQLHLEGKITDIEFNLLQAQFYNYFGIDPVGKADPEKGIEAHVMDFDLNWQRIINDHSRMIFKGTPPTKFMEDV